MEVYGYGSERIMMAWLREFFLDDVTQQIAAQLRDAGNPVELRAIEFAVDKKVEGATRTKREKQRHGGVDIVLGKGGLQRIKEVKNKDHLYLKLDVDPCEACQYDQYFGNGLLNIFNATCQELERVVYKALCSTMFEQFHEMHDYREWLAHKNIKVCVRLKSVPAVPRIPSSQECGDFLTLFRGIIREVCVSEQIIMKGICKSTTIESSCQQLMVIPLVFDHQQELTVTNQRSVCVLIDDELVNKFHVNDLVMVIGFLSPMAPHRLHVKDQKINAKLEHQVGNFYCDAVNVLIRSAIPKHLKSSFQVLSLATPTSLCENFRGCKLGDWSVTKAMLGSFLPRVLPPSLFPKLKLALLLCLSSGHNKAQVPSAKQNDTNELGSDRNINFVIFTDSPLIRRAVLAAASLNPRQQVISTIHKAKGTKSDLLHFGDSSLVVLNLHRGINAKEINFLKHLHLMQAHQVTRFSIGVVLSPSKAVCDSNNSSPSYNLSKEEMELLGMSWFDFVHFAILPPDTTFDRIIAEHLLSSLDDLKFGPSGAENSTDESLKRLFGSQTELIDFLCLARQTETTLSPQAEQLLRLFFLSSRQVDRDNHLNRQALDSMIVISRSHASLHQRTVVTIADALVGIQMVLESLAVRRKAWKSPSASAPLLGFQHLNWEELNVDAMGGPYASSCFSEVQKFKEFYTEVLRFLRTTGHGEWNSDRRIEQPMVA